MTVKLDGWEWVRTTYFELLKTKYIITEKINIFVDLCMWHDVAYTYNVHLHTHTYLSLAQYIIWHYIMLIIISYALYLLISRFT